jgi:ankyrin repeat protein
MNGAIEQIKAAFRQDDAASVRELLARHPELKAKINEPIGGFDSPAILAVRSREMLDVLLAAGADINAKSRWWAGGFGLLHSASPELAAYAIERGAIVDVHAAARLGLLDKLTELIAADPELVHARGGDGQTPLHFASTIEIARYLLDHGAAIDARDVDHESTPAQWMVRDRQDIVRYLITRGCKTDLLMASALGDLELARKHLDDDSDAIRLRVNDENFRMRDRRAGGTIYQWTLGWHVSAHQVAKNFGHEHVLQVLMERSPDEIKLVTACWLGDEAMMNSLLAAEPNLVARLHDADRRQLAHAARNNDLAAVRLMLAIGLPVNATSQHGATPLHWAAFHGNAEMVELILQKNPPLEKTDANFQGTPLNWAIYGSEHGWHTEMGNYGATVEALLRAGARPPQEAAGSAEVKQVLLRQAKKQ